jgi:hypothetical protein
VRRQRRAGGDRVERDLLVRELLRLRVLVDLHRGRLLGQPRQDDDAGVRRLRCRLDVVGEPEGRPGEALDEPLGGRRELIELLVHQVPLERGDDDRVDDRQRDHDDGRQREAQARAKAPDPDHASRKR